MIDTALFPALETLLAVARTGSVGAAARQRHVTSSAVSQQIRRLEAHRRLLVEQVAQHRGEQPLAEIVAHRHPERDGGAAGQLGELSEGGLGPAPELAHHGQRRLASSGETHPTPGALEELDAEVRLEPPDLLAHRGRRHVPLARRRAHRARARDGEQGLQRGEEGGVDHEAELTIRCRTFHWTTR